jgi:hypothetical protein
MRARTITITSLLVCAFAIPATANASPQYSSVNATTGGSQESSQPTGGSDQSSVNAITGGSSEQSAPGALRSAHQVDPSYSSLNATTGATTGERTLASGSPASTDDGFDWLSAAIGAGAAMALVSLGGAAFLTVRRRTAVSPSAA